jgi:hypothetical protein
MKYLAILAVLVSLNALAHSGRTNSSGCHNDRKNGGYHCHQADDMTKEITREPSSVENDQIPYVSDEIEAKKPIFDETK